jgi:hypothetical protein
MVLYKQTEAQPHVAVISTHARTKIKCVSPSKVYSDKQKVVPTNLTQAGAGMAEASAAVRAPRVLRAGPPGTAPAQTPR